jgi:hypothetical protein
MNPREFDKVYTAEIYSNSRQTISTNVQNYFNGYPFLRGIKVKAISITNLTTSLVNYSFITISDVKKNIVVYNTPTSDLILSNYYPNGKLRLYNIDGVDLLNSYWTFTGTSFSVVATTLLMRINFYY